jgi:proton-dependent oligopeptide transporter, POT family
MSDIRDFSSTYPKQIWPLFFSEMWERFCFYGMRGMLIVFMVNNLMMDETTANLQYGATQAFVYAFTFVGGLFADKILGYRKSLFWGGILMIVGSLLLALNPKTWFFLGLGFTIIGTGFFKPNISTMVGQLYHKNDPRQDAGFSLFYAGINLGAFLGGYLCVAIGKGSLFSSIIPPHLSWNFAFGLAAIVMVISLLTFGQTQKSMGDIGLSPLLDKDPQIKRNYEWATYIGSIILVPLVMIMVSVPQYTNLFMYIIGPVTLIYILYETTKLTPVDRKKIWAALVFIIFSMFFWAFFEQCGGSLSLYAEKNLGGSVLGIPLDPNGVNNSAGSFFIILFATALGYIFVQLAKRKLEPNTVIKFGLSFLFLGGGFYIFYLGRFYADSAGISSLDLFTFGWLVITIGELCLSPVGMSIVTKLSPINLQGMMMGSWFLAAAYGQYIAGLLGANIASASVDMSNLEKLMVYTSGYKQLAIYAFIIGVLLIILSPVVRKWMQEIK